MENNKNKWRGIVLAGGSGTRLYPLTRSVSKQLMPVYDKPMIFYPISVLIKAGIREIAIITAPDQQHLFKELLKDGSQWGCSFTYVVQEKPAGLAQAFTLCEDFIKGYHTCLILGDNLFFGHGLAEMLERAMSRDHGATVFGYHVTDPERYGVVEFDDQHRAISIEEKPKHPKSNFAVTGLYFYDPDVLEIAKQVKPSARGELEITDVNKAYLERKDLCVELMSRGIAWLDTGTMDSLIEASEFVQMTEKRQGVKISAPEEIAFRNGWIDKETLMTSALRYGKSPYGQQLKNVAEGKFVY